MSDKQPVFLDEEFSAPKKRRVSQKLRYGTAATALTVLVVVGVVLLNVVASALEARFPISLDLTADDTYTLSDACLAIAAEGDAEVEVVVFEDESVFSSPALGSDELNTIARQFYEAMKQCNIASDGRITTRYINYADNPTLVSKYADYEVDEGSILFLSGERFATVTLMDMFNYDQESYYYYGTLTVTDSLVEQVVATSLRKVSGELAPIVVMVGHDEDSYTLNNIKKVLGNNAYELVECDLTKSDTITEDAITMVIPAPSTDYSNDEIVQIRDWLQQGGEYSRSLVLLTDESAKCPNLYELVEEEYGIEITDQMVSETKSYYQNKYWPYGDIAQNDMFAELGGKQVLSIHTRRLILHNTTEDSYLYDMPLVTFGNSAQLVDMNTEADENTEAATPYNADSYPIVGAALAHKEVPSPTMDISVHSYVAVFGSPYFLDTEILAYISAAENEELFVSVVNTVSGADNAPTISSRSMSTTYLAYEDATSKWLGLGVFTIAVPVITMAIGLIVFLRRRHL